MPDNEKIIECLQKAKMVIETWVPMFEQYNTPAGIDEAIALLKEQEPMQVKTDMYGNAYCPWCSTYRTIEMGAQRLHLGTHFCPYCGKAVKWE